MKQLFLLLTQIFLISCIQILFEVFVDKDERPYQAKIVNLACFVGSLYLVLSFTYETLISELMTMLGPLNF